VQRTHSASEKVDDKHQVEIFIDNVSHPSPKHTTGAALYDLGKVKPNYELLAERKRGDDLPIANTTAPVEVKDQERFHSVPVDLNPGAK
jgi:hypothetical protein